MARCTVAEEIAEKPLPEQRSHVWRDGETKAEYLAAHQRCVRRLRRILARKREMEKWCEKWDAMHERYVKERDELKATKPAGVR
ncbi:hypothetical protein KKZ71_06120 [Enterobacter hormaechei subsp. xiangfangensis]|nr:hypothetical protein [Enterobacter hormaechei subsp. xiangfangensis]